MENKILVTTFYKFQPMPAGQLEDLQQDLEELGQRLKLKGLILIGTEGFNSTVSGHPSSVEALKKYMVALAHDHRVWFKDSWCDWKPFSRFKVKIKDEIVTIGRPGLVPNTDDHFHLDPEEWHKTMEQEDVVVVDTRNTYETEVGVFKDALDLKIDDFQEFTQSFWSRELIKTKRF